MCRFSGRWFRHRIRYLGQALKMFLVRCIVWEVEKIRHYSSSLVYVATFITSAKQSKQALLRSTDFRLVDVLSDDRIPMTLANSFLCSQRLGTVRFSLCRWPCLSFSQLLVRGLCRAFFLAVHWLISPRALHELESFTILYGSIRHLTSL